MPNVLKSWRLSLLEPSGPVQVCNGIALPLPLHKTQQQKSQVFPGHGYVKSKDKLTEAIKRAFHSEMLLIDLHI